MGIYTSTTRYTGSSGIDVESMVSSIMAAESVKYNKLTANKQVTQWKQQAYQGVSAKLKEFQMTYLNMMTPATNMRSVASFYGFKTSVTLDGKDTSKVSVTTSSDTQDGTYKLDVKQLAQAETWTSSASIGSTVSGDLAKMNFEGMKVGDSFKISLDGGAAKTITFTQDDVDALQATETADEKKVTVARILNKKLEAFSTEMVDSVATPKITASFTDDNKLVIVPLTGHKVTLSPGVRRTVESTAATKATFTGTSTDKNFSVKIGDKTVDLKISLGAEDTVYTAAQKLNVELENNGIYGNVGFTVKDGFIKAVGKDTDASVEISGDVGALGFSSTIKLDNTNVAGDFNLASAASGTINLKQSLQSVFGASGFAAASSTGTFMANGKEIKFDKNGTVQQFIDSINTADAGIVASFDTLYGTFNIKSKNTGSENTIDLDDAGKDLFAKIGLGTGPAKEARDALISVNGGAIMTRSTNNFDIYGLQVQLNDTTEDLKPVTITASKDTTSAMDNIKKFVEAYNKLTEEINKEYTDSRPKKSKYDFYQPLTEDEKKNMTETQIKTWEDNAKKGMLNRDPIIGDIKNVMRSMLYESVALPNGKKISLYEIGITTSNVYSDGGKLVIDEKVLSKALTERTADVAELFTKSSTITMDKNQLSKTRMKDEGIAERLNDIVNSAVLSNGTIGKKAGYGTADTGSLMYEELRKMDTKISDAYDALVRKENAYYTKFAAMEAAINASNAQMAALANFTG